MNSTRLLREKIREILLNEIDIEEVSDICYAAGSTHVMRTCRIGGKKYFLKFSAEDVFGSIDPSLQILVEYLAYRIYGLYSGINIPTFELVYDKTVGRVGLATTPARGRQALTAKIPRSVIGRMLSQGAYVDIFLCNWDVVGTGGGNVFIDPELGATRIDPGGSLTFRAQGDRKGGAFNAMARELQTMMNPTQGAGVALAHADLKAAAKTFLSVSWDDVQSEIDTARNEVSEELVARGMTRLLSQWNADCDEIKSVLSERHSTVRQHATHILKQK